MKFNRQSRDLTFRQRRMWMTLQMDYEPENYNAQAHIQEGDGRWYRIS